MIILQQGKLDGRNEILSFVLVSWGYSYTKVYYFISLKIKSSPFSLQINLISRKLLKPYSVMCMTINNTCRSFTYSQTMG